MTDVLDRMAAANPVREDGRPPIDDVWRKIAADRRALRAGHGVAVAAERC